MKSSLRMAFTCLMMSVSPADAQDFEDRLTGDWNGKRGRLYRLGLDLEAVYSTSLWNNFSGGVKEGSTRFDNLDMTLTVDGEKLYGLPGSTIFIYGLKNTGGKINTQYVGSHGGIDNIEVSKSTAKLYEAWIEQNFLEDVMSVRVGLYDFNSEFYVTDTSGLFLNPTYGIGTELSATGKNGPSIFPVTSLAARAKIKITPELYIQAVVMDGVPGNPDNPKGTRIAFENDDGAFWAAEIGYGEKSSVYIGAGAWHYTGTYDDFTDIDASGNPERRHNSGAYALLDAKLTENMNGFARLGITSGEVSSFGLGWSGGLVYTGFLPQRPEGQLGFGVSGTKNSHKFKSAVIAGGTESEIGETQVELTYRDNLFPWLAVQPDLQYTHNPGTNPILDDSWTGGLRMEISF